MENLIVTNAGQALIAKLIAGTAEINFTKIKTSDYVYTASDIPALTELFQIKQTANVSSISIVSSSIVKVRALINNTGLNTGYYVNAVGLYATDSSTNTEILFGVSLCGDLADYIPAQSDTVTGITYTFNCKVDNTEQVTVTVDPSGVASAEDLEELQETVYTLGGYIDGKATKVSSGTEGNLVALTSTGDIADSGSKSSDFASSSHTSDAVASSTGVHGLRYYDNKLQYYDNNTWNNANTATHLYLSNWSISGRYNSDTSNYSGSFQLLTSYEPTATNLNTFKQMVGTNAGNLPILRLVGGSTMCVTVVSVSDNKLSFYTAYTSDNIDGYLLSEDNATIGISKIRSAQIF